jgi:hypothetical protein
MGEMVERVARAIWEKEGEINGWGKDASAASFPIVRSEHEAIARAAIAAMREPAREQDAVMRVVLGPDTPPTRRWHWVWQEMIDAVLNAEKAAAPREDSGQ